MGQSTAVTSNIAGSALLALAGSALLLCSCKEPTGKEPTGDKPSGEPLQSATSAEATGPERSSPPTRGEPHKEPGQVVYYFAKDKLFGQRTGAKREALTTIAGPGFCVSDPGHNALWISGDAGLSLYDLESKSKELIVNAKKPIEAFEVRFGDGQGQVGNANELQDMAALVLMLTPTEVSLRAEVLCDGDLSHYCFIEDGDDPELWEHTEELKELLAGYKTMHLRKDGKAKLQALAGRKAAIESLVPQAVPPAPKVAIDKSKCEEEPEDCGTGEFLGGSYWKIISGNSRGDFYHESYGLYDSKRAGWIEPDTGQLVKNASNATFELLALASDRSSMLTAGGTWFSFEEGTTTLRLGKDSAFCGYGK